jgi:hypothetical protein
MSLPQVDLKKPAEPAKQAKEEEKGLSDDASVKLRWESRQSR